jgi:hypothetical protein
MVAGDDYSHFPRLARGADRRLGVLYYRGFNHGSADAQGIAAPQQPRAPGRLTIDGTYARAGRAVLPTGAQIIISVAKDESARTFTVVGQDRQGRNIQETIAGPPSKRAYSRHRYLQIDSIEVDGPTRGQVSVGPRVVPSNMEFRTSDDDGRSWSKAVALADGMSTDTFYYVGALAGLRQGTFVAIYLRINSETGRTDSLRRVSTDNGRSWSEPEPIRYSGASSVSTFRVWGQIQATSSGQLVAMGYAGQENWSLVSNDLGRTWQASLIVKTPPETDYNEMAVALVSDTEWVAIARGATRGEGGSSMRQFASRDGGRSWTDLGWTNAERAGGYVSPAMQTMRCGSQPVVLWAYMARASRSRPPPTPNSLVLRRAPSAGAIASANVWSGEEIIGRPGSFLRNSGYPSIVIDDDCSGGVVVAGRETSDVTAGVVAMKWMNSSLQQRRGR